MQRSYGQSTNLPVGSKNLALIVPNPFLVQWPIEAFADKRYVIETPLTGCCIDFLSNSVI